MLLIIREKATPEQIKEMVSDIEGYIKIVIDIERKILTGGGARHVDGEQVLLEDGSKQENLWGGGLDLATREIDFDSIINVRPKQNDSREVLSADIRKACESIVRKLIQL